MHQKLIRLILCTSVCFSWAASKTIFLLNPWPASGPLITLNGSKDTMNIAPKCGWYTYDIQEDQSSYQVSFQEIFTEVNYGASGISDPTPIDLTALFATTDTIYILPTPQPNAKVPAGDPVLLTLEPSITGDCIFNLGITIRDFSINHPDFEFSTSNMIPMTGMVLSDLGPDGKPRQNPAVNGMADGVHMTEFYTWFITTTTGVEAGPLANYETCYDLPFSKTRDGMWAFDSYQEPSHGFFPIDDFENPHNTGSEKILSQYQPLENGEFLMQWLPDPTGEPHNFFFCSELHAKFVFGPNQTFTVGADNDLWVFVDNKLVIDLGGVHLVAQANLDMDSLATANGLSPGEEYSFDLFQCERHTTTSHLYIKTSIYFEQNQAVWLESTELGGGVMQYNVKRRTGPDESCGGIGISGDEIVQDEPASFTLNGILIEESTYAGITLLPGDIGIVIDTSLINASLELPMGSYSIVARNTGNLPYQSFLIPFVAGHFMTSTEEKKNPPALGHQNITVSPSGILTTPPNQTYLPGEIEILSLEGKSLFTNTHIVEGGRPVAFHPPHPGIYILKDKSRILKFHKL